jgi:hypothetical protein
MLLPDVACATLPWRLATSGSHTRSALTEDGLNSQRAYPHDRPPAPGTPPRDIDPDEVPDTPPTEPPPVPIEDPRPSQAPEGPYTVR